MPAYLRELFVLLPVLGWGICAQGATHPVSNKAELAGILKRVQAGDTIELSSGEWDSLELSLTMKGTEAAPVVIKGASDGRTVITGRSCIQLGGCFVTVRDLYFRGVEPPDGKSAIFYFRKGSDQMADQCRLTNCVFDSCNPVDFERRYAWVQLYGRNNCVDRNLFLNHNHSGVTVQVKLAEAKAGHRIERNHFLHRAPGDGNGFECIQIGQSQDSEKDGDCLVASNLFERCDGETEIISSKTGNNVFRLNTFLESAGTLTLRHGNHNLVEQNVFLGRGKLRTGGIRVICHGHTIRNNYMDRLYGRTGGCIVLYAGIPNSPLNGYFAANDAVVENNLIVNCLGVGLYVGGGYGERGRTILPENLSVQGNLVHLAPSGDAALEGELQGVVFENNRTDAGGVAEGIYPVGFQVVPMKLIKKESGLWMPVDPAANELFRFNGTAPKIISRRDVGPDWGADISKHLAVDVQ